MICCRRPASASAFPDDHLIGYVMAFGRPAVRYARTVQHGPALISRFAG